LGNVRIGRHCVFSYNIYAAAGSHVIDTRPAWLIKDQDEAFGRERNRSEQTTIEDDVWIGWGVFVASGVTIGRGAVLGANAVVTTDVEPYAIYAGAPARKIGQRLTFSPPQAVRAASEDCTPYFYRGFATDQAALTRSRAESVVWAVRSPAVIALPSGPFSDLLVRGRTSGAGGLAARFALDGVACSEQELPVGEFLLRLRAPQGVRPLRAGFRALEIAFDEGARTRLGISEVSVVQAAVQAHSKAS
jgi:hypothetical protein